MSSLPVCKPHNFRSGQGKDWWLLVAAKGCGVIGAGWALFAFLGPLMPVLLIIGWFLFFGYCWLSDVAEARP